MDSTSALLNMAFHAAAGPKPPDEHGLDGQVKLCQRGTTWIAVLQIMTAAGPVTLAAAADEKVIVSLLAMAMRRGPGFLAAVPDAIRSAARRIAQQVAKEAVMAKVSGAARARAGTRVGASVRTQRQGGAMPPVRPGAPRKHAQPKHALRGFKTGTRFGAVPGTSKEKAAANLYTRLVQKDPTAWAAVQKIIQTAQMPGSPAAQKAAHAWKLLLRCHAKRKMLGWGAGTPAQMTAAARIYARLNVNDPDAWQALLAIAKKAQTGDLKAQQAWGILEQVHTQSMSRHASLSGAFVALAPARVTQLVSMARAAASSIPMSSQGPASYGAPSPLAPPPYIAPSYFIPTTTTVQARPAPVTPSPSYFNPGGIKLKMS